jgi:hypothetical protein
VAAAAVVGLLFAFGVLSTNHSSSAPSTPVPQTYENLTIQYDEVSGIANYSSPFISLVGHSLVEMTITNYDPTTSPLFVHWDNQVIGTVGGNETLDCGHGLVSVTSLPQDGISHTWTVLDSYYNISVPIPPAPNLTSPCVVHFALSLSHSEMTTWGCVADCDNGQMAAGRMWGLLLVTA